MTSIKTLSMRLRKTSGELQSLDEDASGAAESVTQLQTKLLNLTHGKVNIIMDDNETFKSTYTIVSELAEVWQTLTDVEQAGVTELVAGTRQANTFNSLMQGMSTAADVVEAAANSEGEQHCPYVQKCA